MHGIAAQGGIQNAGKYSQVAPLPPAVSQLNANQGLAEFFFTDITAPVFANNRYRNVHGDAIFIFIAQQLCEHTRFFCRVSFCDEVIIDHQSYILIAQSADVAHIVAQKFDDCLFRHGLVG